MSLNLTYLISNVSYIKSTTLKTLSPQYSQWSQNKRPTGIVWSTLYLICLSATVTSITGRQIQNYRQSVSWYIADIKLLNKNKQIFFGIEF